MLLGKYHQAPILWRVIHKEGNGDVILLSDRMITLKAFDAKGPKHPVGKRQSLGSNYYPGSNIRQWLNSTAPKINWLQNAPLKANLKGQYDEYATEKGFLADGNFTAIERSLMKPLTHKVLLSTDDFRLRDGGLNFQRWDGDIRRVVSNYDEAYYKNVTDSVFLLSVKQLKEYVYDRRHILGDDYYRAKPTKEAIANSRYRNSSMKDHLYWYYWLNTPATTNQSNVRVIFPNGVVENALAYNEVFGVRPAFRLNVSMFNGTVRATGLGTEGQPVVLN
jgi:hypothetical protein